MDTQLFKADHTMLLMLIVLLEDRGIISGSDIQERLRQTREGFAARYGEGNATALIERAMHALSEKRQNVVALDPKRPEPT